MPTITYEVETRCFNCGEEQDTTLPRNHALSPYNPPDGYVSCYYNKYREKFIEKKCINCKEAMLIPVHLWDVIIARAYES